MKLKIKTVTAYICVLWLVLTALYAPAFCELRISEIPILEIKGGSGYSFNLSPYIYNTAKDREMIAVFKNLKNLGCTYKTGTVFIEPDAGFYGLAYFTINIKNKDSEESTADIIVKAARKSKTTVVYKADGDVSDVFIAGEFNGWNPKATRMSENENGLYSAELDIPPGSYQYKIVVDGEWIADPANQNTASDGFGGKNSVLVIGRKGPEIIPVSRKNGEFVFSCSGEISDCLAAENNRILSPKLKNNIITVKTEANIFDFKVIACDKDGNFSNELCFSAGGEKTFNWRDGVIYFAFIDRFFNGDKINDKSATSDVTKSADYSGGDLQGIISKIKKGYFEKLGVNVLWLSPVIDNPEEAFREDNPPHKKYSAYHGYWPVDIYKVENHFGTKEKLAELVKLAHKNNMKVILDAVFNHVHKDNAIYRENPQWFTPLDLPDGRKNIRLFDEYPFTTWFDSFNPTFDYENNSSARNMMIKNALWWIKEFDVDGFRLDAAKHIPHLFWKELRAKIKNEIEFPENRTFYMVGESIASRETIAEFVNEEELNGQFDFPLYWAIRDVFAWETQGFDRLESDMKNSQKIYKNGVMSTLLGNHDFARFTAFADGDIKPGMDEKDEKISAEIDNPGTYKKLKLAWTFILTNPGIPMVYYGDEIGLCGKGDPDNRRMMKFEINENEKDILKYVSKLIEVRSKNPALRYGINTTVVVEKDFYVYKNVWFDNEIVVVLNRSDEIIERDLNLGGNWEDLFTGKKYELKGIRVEPKSAMVFKSE